MPRNYLLTNEVARAAGVHPNTVRLYEEMGFIAPVPRTPAGYRMYSEAHRQQMILAHLALVYPYPGGKKVVLDMLHHVIAKDYKAARQKALRYRENIQSELALAQAAADYLESWVSGADQEKAAGKFLIGEAAEMLSVSRDVLRDWERNGLIRIARDSQNRYRRYSIADVGRLRVIRVLRQAGYSTMAVLRMTIALDQGQRHGLGQLLDAAVDDDDICYITDRWISTLKAQETRSIKIIEFVEALGRKSEKPAELP